MSRLIAAIPCTRPDSLGDMVKSLQDCDEVRIGYDFTRRGPQAVRNELSYGLNDDDVIRFCDDDDVACNSRVLWQEFSTQADALLFSYRVNERLITVPSDPRIAAVDHTIVCNWMIRGSVVRQLGHTVFDPKRYTNQGTWAWLQILDFVDKSRIQVEPAIVGYEWKKGPGTISSKGWTDNDLFDHLKTIAANNFQAQVDLRARMARR